MNKKLTIILTLKNRIEFTYRWMNYMNDLKCPYLILIADGGDNKTIENDLNDYSKYPNLNYKYIRYPFDLNLSFFYKKLIDVISRINTPYMLFADNDDFFTLKNFEKLIDFLEKNPDFVSCGGDYISLSLLSKENKVINSPVANNYIAQKYNQVQSLDFEASTDRIVYFFENVESQILWCSWYNIQRTSAIKKSLEILSEYEFNEVVAFEIYFHISMLTLGKYKIIKTPFYIRQNGTSQITSELNQQSNLFKRFIENNTFREILKSIEIINPKIKEVEKNIIVGAFFLWFASTPALIYKIPKKTFLSKIRKSLDSLNNFFIFYSIRLIKLLVAKILNDHKLSYLRIPTIKKYIKEF
jgi:glycosyltransferase domain-containing protein